MAPEIAAALLRRGAMVHAASCALTVAALVGATAAAMLGLPHRALWLSLSAEVVVAGLVEFWLAVRVAVDADLFAAIGTAGNDLDRFDRSMSELGLLAADKTGRPLIVRIRGALRLLKLQAAMLIVQMLAFVIGALCRA